ncbi:MAG: hypothetical protein ACI4DW_00230 [Lachnospiraceae bacterium]
MVGRIMPAGYGTNYGLYGTSLSTAWKNNINTPSDSINAEGSTSASSSRAVRKTECQTCKNRKYVDGSDEMVSFKSPTKMSPERAASAVRAHEQEHVTNAYGKAASGDGQVLQASVALKTAICPECGRAYIAGGTTTTRIAYQKDNPYSQNLQSQQAEAATGNNFDQAV